MRIKRIVASVVSTALLAVTALAVSPSHASATVQPYVEGGDIYRVRNLTKGSDFMDPASADACDTLQYRVRIHNPGPDQILTNVTVQAGFQSAASTKNVSVIVIRASNAHPSSTSDTATVNLSSSQKVSYLSGSSELLDQNGNFIRNIGDVTQGSGVNIGNVGISVNEKRFVQFKAKVNCPTPPESSGMCKLLSMTVVNKDDREVQASVTGEVNNATIIGYSIDFGDGTVVEQQSANHKYAKDGTYNVVGTVKVKLANGEVQSKTAQSCESQITFTPNKPPKVTPPPTPSSLPNTGPGDVIAAFFGISSISSVLYYAVTRRLAK